MKNLISLVWGISLIVICTNQIYSQEKKFHQVIFGDENSNEQILDYSFGKEIAPIDNYQKYKNNLEIQADFTMAYIWIYNEFGFELYLNIDTNYVVITLPNGVYNLIIGYMPKSTEHSLITKEKIVISGNSLLKLSIEEAIYSNTYFFKKINNDTLNISSIMFYIFNLLTGSGLRVSYPNIDSDSFLVKHNLLPDHFRSQWAVKGKPRFNNYDYYLINNRWIFFETDTTVSNDINNYAFADIDYYLPDSILHSTEKRIFTFLPDLWVLGRGDIKYTYPLTERIYQDTTANISLFTSKFSQSLYMSSPLHYIDTPEIRFKKNKIIGYHWRDYDAPGFIISDTNYVQLGQPPAFWFGKFSNSPDTVKIVSSYGLYEYLFLSQTNDLLQHHPLEYKIYQNSALIDSGLFELKFWAHLRVGFDPNDLAIPIQPGEYTVNVNNDYNQIRNIRGYSEVNASFDLNNTDKNPPNIVSFQLLSGKEITHQFYNQSNNKIRFIAEDNVLIDSVSLYYSHFYDTIKVEIPLVFNDPYFEGNLPELPPGYFNLRTYIQDNSQNYIECNMSPAFVIDSSVMNIYEPKTIAKEFELFQNYPNPFNSSTSIRFSVPQNNNKSIKISLYNILGQHIITLLNQEFNTSKNKIIWNGKNKRGKDVPSGIYFIKMKGGEIVKSRKILLLR